MKLGLKLWSTNNQYLNSAKTLLNKGIYDYIELYAVPNTLDSIEMWKEINTPYIIHAPHSGAGVNWADSRKEDFNKKAFEETLIFADRLDAEYIILHPGIDGKLEETLNQLKALPVHDKVLVENKPKRVVCDPNAICRGHSFEEMKLICQETKLGFCLDLGHAIYAANSQGLGPLDVIDKFLELNPRVYHIADGNYASEFDTHDNLGYGNFPLSEIFKILGDIEYMTIETRKQNHDNLDDSHKDFNYIIDLLKKVNSYETN